jgi:hypothetical protein
MSDGARIDGGIHSPAPPHERRRETGARKMSDKNQVNLTGNRDDLEVSEKDSHDLAALTYEERKRLFVLSGIPRRSQDEEAEYAYLKARLKPTQTHAGVSARHRARAMNSSSRREG